MTEPPKPTPKPPGEGGKLLVDRVADLEKKRPARRPRNGRKAEDKLAAALRAVRREAQDDPALEDFREELFRELRKMIRPAIEQAKKGKPALLRILTRYTR